MGDYNEFGHHDELKINTKTFTLEITALLKLVALRTRPVVFVGKNNAQNIPSLIPMGTRMRMKMKKFLRTSLQSEGTMYGISVTVRW